MLLLYGRRRLGKTFLLQRYFTAGVDGDEHEKPHSYFLAERSSAAIQRLTLARQWIAALASEGVAAEDVVFSSNALLRYASQQAKGRKKGAGRFALILDEFPYLVAQTPELPSILQAWWVREAVHFSRLRLSRRFQRPSRTGRRTAYHPFWTSMSHRTRFQFAQFRPC
jgi:AAA+ ATPase superfamily predicted ATPase